MAETEEVARGARFVIYAVKDSVHTKSHLAEFMEGMRPEAVRKLWALIQDTADNGPPRHPERCKKLVGVENLFELKSKPFRVFFFYEGREGDRGRIVLTHGFRKKSDSTPRREIERALRLREALRGRTGR